MGRGRRARAAARGAGTDPATGRGRPRGGVELAGRHYPVPDANEGPLRPKDLIGEDEEIAPLLEPGGLSLSAAGSPLEEEESWLGAH